MSYKVVPFNQADDAADELQKIINSQATAGYKYVSHQYSDKLDPGKAGCFFGLFGSKDPSTVHVGFVVFEKID